MEVQCDNQGAVALVNSGYSKVPQLMHMLRYLFFIRATFNFSLRAVHVPGKDNILADAISRDNIQLLYSQVPEAARDRCLVPSNLVEIMVGQEPDWGSQTWSRQFLNYLQRV